MVKKSTFRHYEDQIIHNLISIEKGSVVFEKSLENMIEEAYVHLQGRRYNQVAKSLKKIDRLVKKQNKKLTQIGGNYSDEEVSFIRRRRDDLLKEQVDKSNAIIEGGQIKFRENVVGIDAQSINEIIGMNKILAEYDSTTNILEPRQESPRTALRNEKICWNLMAEHYVNNFRFPSDARCHQILGSGSSQEADWYRFIKSAADSKVYNNVEIASFFMNPSHIPLPKKIQYEQLPTNPIQDRKSVV